MCVNSRNAWWTRLTNPSSNKRSSRKSSSSIVRLVRYSSVKYPRKPTTKCSTIIIRRQCFLPHPSSSSSSRRLSMFTFIHSSSNSSSRGTPLLPSRHPTRRRLSTFIIQVAAAAAARRPRCRSARVPALCSESWRPTTRIVSPI